MQLHKGIIRAALFCAATLFALYAATPAAASDLGFVTTNLINFPGSSGKLGTQPADDLATLGIINPTFFGVTTGGSQGTVYSYPVFDPLGSVPQLQPTGIGSPTAITAYAGAIYGVKSGGRVFSLTPNAGGTSYTLTNKPIQDFNSDFTLGTPAGPIVMAHSSTLGATAIFGTTTNGGDFGQGIIYQTTTDGTFAEQLFDFGAAGGSGGTPEGLATDGTALYGITQGGGTAGMGTIFKINFDGSGYQVLHTFSGGDGANPTGTLSIVDGIIAGATANGGSANDGTIFDLKTDGTGFSTLHTFTGADGAHPAGGPSIQAPIIEGPNTIFSRSLILGTTHDGGAFGDGSIFQLTFDGTFHQLYSFSGPDGANPTGALHWDGPESSDYTGTTINGGADGGGTMFRLELTTPEPSTILSGSLGALCTLVAAWRRHSLTPRS